MLTVQDRFPAGSGYLAACTQGLPTHATVAAGHADLDSWASGAASPADYDRAVHSARASFARLAGVPVDAVAIGSQVSVLASLVAASVPNGATVLCAEGDFASMIAPFHAQAHRGVTVHSAPLVGLADAVDEQTWLVAFSLVQSATGEIADVDALLEACSRTRTRTFADLTQALGWLPVDASRFDATATHAYKWLCAPRGAAFLTVTEGIRDRLVPVHAGWFAGDDPWSSCYGPVTTLARGARRFDVSPAWPVWPGTAAALSLFDELDIHAIHAHTTALGDAFADGLGLRPRGQAIVTWDDPDARALADLTAAGLHASGRAGRARVAFHLWNDEADVHAALRAVRTPAFR